MFLSMERFKVIRHGVAYHVVDTAIDVFGGHKRVFVYERLDAHRNWKRAYAKAKRLNRLRKIKGREAVDDLPFA